MSKGLTPKQQKFIAEYLVDQNGTKAAIRAGYSETGADVEGTRLLAKASIRAEVDAGLAAQKAEIEKRAKKGQITLEKWLNSVAAQAFSDMDGFVTIDALGKGKVIPTAERKKGSGQLIKKISVSQNGTVTFELHSKSQAQELLAKHFGWISEQIHHSGEIGNPSALTDEAVQDIFKNKEIAAMARRIGQEISKSKRSNQGEGNG